MKPHQWKRFFSTVVLQCLLLCLLVWWTPPEKVLGLRIRWVLLHVSFIWAGLLGLFAAAIAGVFVGWHRELKGFLWLQSGAFFSLVFFGIGLLLSMMAAQANWGGVFWQEPRMKVMFGMLFLTTLVQTINVWLPSKRWRCWNHLLPAGALLLALWFTPLVLHPRNPIQSSTSLRFHFLFAASLLVCLGSLIALSWAVTKDSERNAGQA